VALGWTTIAPGNGRSVIASSVLVSYTPLFLKGLWVTLKLTGVAILLGSTLGVIVGIVRASGVKWLRVLATLYIGLFRSIPILLIVFFSYFALPIFFNFNFPQYEAAVLALAVYCSAYMAEIVRGSINAISPGQKEAAQVLGLSRIGTLRYIILPQAFVIALPPAISVCIMTFKDSSVVSIIGYFELTATGLAIREIDPGNEATALGALLVIGAMYFVIAYSLSLVGTFFETRTRRKFGSNVLTTKRKAFRVGARPMLEDV
jgi:His/Glu/Gln/Arg/opine family amino acid ABC transporter permease subunit